MDEQQKPEENKVNAEIINKEGLPPSQKAYRLAVPDPAAAQMDKGADMLTGDFTFKRLALMEMGQVAVETARLNGGMSPEVVGNEIDTLHSMLAQCKFSIAEAPKWFNLETLRNSDALRTVYTAIGVFENSFRRVPQG